VINTLNAELNPICHRLSLLGAHPILRVSRIRVKNDCVFFEHNNFSADKISNDEHPEKMRLLYNEPTVSRITGFKSKFNKYKVYSSCKISYAILSKTVARDASKLVKPVIINRRATDPRVSASGVNFTQNNINTKII
jgi:hypothetical protein